MTADSTRERQLFDQALDRPAEERDAFLDEACAGDPELRARIDALLVSLDAASEFFAEPAPPPGGANEHAGKVIDRYELLQQIGEGGFGTVWMADQKTPVRRKVALKVIKLGMNTRQVVARFEAERQALALMEHPNIAKVFDGGITPGGRPYFVMELIAGVPITEYCDQAELDTPERLELFQQVCHAVQHAHQKGVIHRDLKPNNILVTLHDGVPVPKVIDFGVAKATSAELTAKTLFTEFRHMIGTPEYMAPEQAGLSGLDVDTRADVYSLGVVLYEILTGSKPFATGSLIEKGYLEMLRVIREDTPPKPSTRISTLGQQQAVVARQRHATPASLSRLLHGDLDWIVMKALEKDRSRRYVTANDLAADIGRHLQHEPVQAGPPSVVYRFSKYLRRHRLGVFTGAVVALALVGGVAVATWSWFEADAQRGRAEKAERVALGERDTAQDAREHAESEERKARTAAERANAVIVLLEKMLGAANPVSGRDHYSVSQLLDAFDRDLMPELAIHAEVEASLRSIMGRAFTSLGQYTKAERQLRLALELRNRSYPEGNALVADSLAELASALSLAGSHADAEAMARAAVDLDRRLPGDERLRLARHLNEAGTVIQSGSGKLEEAEAMLREALAINNELLGDEHSETSNSRFRLAWVLQGLNRLAEAELLSRDALRINRNLFGTGHPNVADALSNLACCLISQGKFEEAENACLEGLAMNRKLYPNGHRNVAGDLNNLSLALAGQGKLVEAEARIREALEMDKTQLGDEHQSVASELDNLGKILQQQGKLESAEEMQRQALTMRRACLDNEHPDIVTSCCNLASVLVARKKFAEAEPLLADAVVRSKKLHGDVHPVVADRLSDLGGCFMAQGKHAQAEATFSDSIAMRRTLYGDEHPSLEVALGGLARVLMAQGKLTEAEAPLRKALAMGCRLRGNADPRVALVLNRLVSLLAQQGRLSEAEAATRDVLVENGRLLGKGNPNGAASLYRLTTLLVQQGKQAEAESLWREELARDRGLRGREHLDVAIDLSNLSQVLTAQGRLVEAEASWVETVELTRKVIGKTHPSVANVLRPLTALLMGQGRFAEAEDGLRETLAIERATPAAANPAIATTLATLGYALLQQGKCEEAERRLRECLEIRAETMPDSWLRYNAMSLLGGALLGLGRHAEAEPLLLDGHEKMQPPADAATRKTEALERVVQLYESWGKPEKAATWRAKLAAPNAARK